MMVHETWPIVVYYAEIETLLSERNRAQAVKPRRKDRYFVTCAIFKSLNGGNENVQFFLLLLLLLSIIFQ